MLKEQKYIVTGDSPRIIIGALKKHFDTVCVLDSNNQYNSPGNARYSQLVALGANDAMTVYSPENIFTRMQDFYEDRRGWLFGYITYDVKNCIENLQSGNKDGLGYPYLHFFAPEVVIQIIENSVTVFYDDNFTTEAEAEEIYKVSFSTDETGEKVFSSKIDIQPRITKEEYIEAVNQLKQHIHKGDIYEVNFCTEFFAENAEVNTVEIYERLNEISRAPFASYCKVGDQYLMSASPERFLSKQGNKLISQPMKGTARRSENKAEDNLLKQELQNNAKEQSENVMIVDLVRNDLSKVAKRGSVKVEELFGVYSFKQVHQMISTISCELKENTSFADILKSTFPMGSMTGAPKVSAMKLIEEYETTKRGLYSGAVGYITPDGDFDFNVVIRSILYNAENNYLSFMVGSAITDKADAAQEYEECLLKAKAMLEVLV